MYIAATVTLFGFMTKSGRVHNAAKKSLGAQNMFILVLPFT